MGIVGLKIVNSLNRINRLTLNTLAQLYFKKSIHILDPVSIKHGLRTADYRLRTGYKIRTRYKTETRKHGLGIKHGQGIKRRLWTADGVEIRTTDYFEKNGANWF